MDQKVVVTTGASSGIGAALARQLAGQGWRCVLAARRREELEKVAASLGAESLVVPTDVTKRKQIEVLKEAALAKFGRIDVWVNNAGRGISKPALELTDEEIDDMMSLNLKSALYGMQVIVPYFEQRGAGHVINVSSFLGRVPLAPYRAAYSAAKAALLAITSNARMDLGRKGSPVMISSVMPGIVSTDFAKNALHGTPVMTARPGGGMQAQSAEEVAGAIAELIQHPKAELYTNPASLGLLQAYTADVEAFEKRWLEQQKQTA